MSEARLSGKVALITGAARGQGRSHAVSMAREGADIVIQDLCDSISTVPYPMATKDDLDETLRLVEAEGRRCIAERGDVRDLDGMRALVEKTRSEFGRLDILIPNAGIMPALAEGDEDQGFNDCVDIMLTGVWNTLRAAVPLMREAGNGGSIVIISSAAGLGSVLTPNAAGTVGYMAAKHGVVGIMRYFANTLAADMIRVNTVHPTGVNSPMIVNDAFTAMVEQHPDTAAAIQNALPVPVIEMQDVTNAILWLVSDAARYVTGITLPVDAGFLVRA